MSTPECRKDCDVYKDWQKMECDIVDIQMENSKLRAENKEIKEELEKRRKNEKML